MADYTTETKVHYFPSILLIVTHLHKRASHEAGRNKGESEVQLELELRHEGDSASSPAQR